MISSINFCLTKVDLLEVIRNVEQSLPIKYVQTEIYLSEEVNQYFHLEEYDFLGVSQSGAVINGDSFLVLEKNSTLSVRCVLQNKGGKHYFVDQLENKDSVILRPGGIYQETYLICGQVGTISKSAVSQKIMRAFQKGIKAQCHKKVGRYYIGNNAATLYGQKRFITIDINEAKEYDLEF